MSWAAGPAGRAAEACHAAVPELYFRVALWLSANPDAKAQQLRDRFSVSRATAYRWLDHFRAAKGVA